MTEAVKPEAKKPVDITTLSDRQLLEIAVTQASLLRREMQDVRGAMSVLVRYLMEPVEEQGSVIVTPGRRN